MTGTLGGFFLGLAWDRVTGQADTPGRVQYRAAQLRCANNAWLVSDGDPVPAQLVACMLSLCHVSRHASHV